MQRPDEAALDPILERVHHTSAVWRGELANHAPMAAEALVSLGRADALEAFFADYRDNLEEASPIPAQPLDDWERGLGDRGAAPRLTGHFLAAVDRDGVIPVVQSALPRLFDGVLGGSLHGLLRLAHALRGWRHRDSPVRQREVAHALGYWASEHTPLPGDPGSAPQAGLGPAQALALIPTLPEDRWVDGIITARAVASAEWEPFLAALAGVDFAGASVDQTIASLVDLAASLFLTTDSPRARFTYLHAITATSALREVLPLLEMAAQRRAIRHHWHALAAIQCMTSSRRTPEERSAPAPSPAPVDEDALVASAVDTLDDHAIKLTAAALTERAHHDASRALMAASRFATRR